MKAIQRLFKVVYAHGRRKHSHRCRACWKVMSAGDPALMLRLGRKTVVIHEECCGKPHPCGTWKDAMRTWAGLNA